jgi:hypothetical protein
VKVSIVSGKPENDDSGQLIMFLTPAIYGLSMLSGEQVDQMAVIPEMVGLRAAESGTR